MSLLPYLVFLLVNSFVSLHPSDVVCGLFEHCDEEDKGQWSDESE